MGIRNVFTRNADRVKNPHKASPEQHSRALRTALIAVLVLVGIGLTGWLITSLTRDDPGESTQPAPASTTTAPDRPETTGAPAPSTCLENDPADVSSDAPDTDRWVFEGFGAVPEVSGAGPCEVLDSGFNVGFAHTMTGAVVAAQWYSATVTPNSPDEDTIQVIQDVMVEGANRENILAETEQILDGERERGNETISRSLEIVGYKVLSYDNDEAEIQLAYVSSIPDAAGRTFGAQVKLEWVDNDWKIVPVSTSSWGTPSEVATLDGFVEWGPQAGDD